MPVIDENRIPEFKRRFERAAPIVVRDEAGRIATRIVKTIEAQPEDWEPLSEQYAKRKGELAMLVDTGAMKNSIEPSAVKSAGNEHVSDVGILRETARENPKHKRNVLEYAAAHEFGFLKITGLFTMRYIPERSFMRKTIDEQEGEIMDEMTELINGAIDDALQ